MTRDAAIARATETFDSGAFLALLREAVAYPTESQAPGQESGPARLSRQLHHPVGDAPRLRRSEEIRQSGRGARPVPDRRAARGAGSADRADLRPRRHGAGLSRAVARGARPWEIVVEGDRWYGRGTADNKGQHIINLAALEQVIAARDGRLGFNVKLLIEMGEESGSPGLRPFCRAQAEALRSDVLIASDGPRLSAERPDPVPGLPGRLQFRAEPQPARGPAPFRQLGRPAAQSRHRPGLGDRVHGRCPRQHPGRRPAAAADPRGRARRAPRHPGRRGSDRADDRLRLGRARLTPAERVFAWNTLEVLAFKTGDPDGPLNAVCRPTRKATLQLRFVVGTDWRT